MTCATALVVTIFISLSLAQSPSAPDEVISNCVEAFYKQLTIIYQVVSLTPLNLAADQITASSVQLSWQRPGGKLRNEVKEYKVFYRAGKIENSVMTM